MCTHSHTRTRAHTRTWKEVQTGEVHRPSTVATAGRHRHTTGSTLPLSDESHSGFDSSFSLANASDDANASTGVNITNGHVPPSQGYTHIQLQSAKSAKHESSGSAPGPLQGAVAVDAHPAYPSGSTKSLYSKGFSKVTGLPTAAKLHEEYQSSRDPGNAYDSDDQVRLEGKIGRWTKIGSVGIWRGGVATRTRN